MVQKATGEEPSVEVTIIRCAVATLNPTTKRPFCDRKIRKVWLEDCYDIDPDHAWKYQYPLQKIALPDDVKEHRLTMSRNIYHTQDYGSSASWWPQNGVWIDPCASVLPRSQRQYIRMRQAELGNKGRLISDDAKMYSRNLRGRKEALKQASWEALRISWIIVLARGKVAVEMPPEDWALDGAGMADAARLLRGILRRMLGGDAHLPRVIFSERGTGMYAPSGRVVRPYADATNAAGFRLYWVPDAKQQAPDMGDMLLHETGVSWFRGRMRREKPEVVPWEETRAQWAARAARCVRQVNAEYDVAGLCREFPARLLDCIEREGDRLPK